MTDMNDSVSNESQVVAVEEQETVESLQEPVATGDTIDVNFRESVGVIILGIISLVLLWAFLRSEARVRELMAGKE